MNTTLHAEQEPTSQQQANAERQARRINNQRAAKAPLLAWAGLLETYTAEDHLVKQAVCRASLKEMYRASERRALDAIEMYMDICSEFVTEQQMRTWTEQINRSSRPKTLEYFADYWYQRLKDAIGCGQRCTCGGIWLNGHHHARVKIGYTHILDFFCNTCGAPYIPIR